MSSATRIGLADALDATAGWRPRVATGVIVLADGVVIEGFGVGATGSAVGEVCFNTAMTGYEEILTDPSYAAQIVTFTFPHIGIVGVNDEDIEVVNAAGRPRSARSCAPKCRGRRISAPRGGSTAGSRRAGSSA